MFSSFSFGIFTAMKTMVWYDSPVKGRSFRVIKTDLCNDDAMLLKSMAVCMIIPRKPRRIGFR